jgi:hypothetical protein
LRGDLQAARDGVGGDELAIGRLRVLDAAAPGAHLSQGEVALVLVPRAQELPANQEISHVNLWPQKRHAQQACKVVDGSEGGSGS